MEAYKKLEKNEIPEDLLNSIVEFIGYEPDYTNFYSAQLYVSHNKCDYNIIFRNWANGNPCTSGMFDTINHLYTWKSNIMRLKEHFNIKYKCVYKDLYTSGETDCIEDDSDYEHDDMFTAVMCVTID